LSKCNISMRCIDKKKTIHRLGKQKYNLISTLSLRMWMFWHLINVYHRYYINVYQNVIFWIYNVHLRLQTCKLCSNETIFFLFWFFSNLYFEFVSRIPLHFNKEFQHLKFNLRCRHYYYIRLEASFPIFWFII